MAIQSFGQVAPTAPGNQKPAGPSQPPSRPTFKETHISKPKQPKVAQTGGADEFQAIQDADLDAILAQLEPLLPGLRADEYVKSGLTSQSQYCFMVARCLQSHHARR